MSFFGTHCATALLHSPVLIVIGQLEITCVRVLHVTPRVVPVALSCFAASLKPRPTSSRRALPLLSPSPHLTSHQHPLPTNKWWNKKNPAQVLFLLPACYYQRHFIELALFTRTQDGSSSSPHQARRLDNMDRHRKGKCREPRAARDGGGAVSSP